MPRISSEAVKAATGKSWQEWFVLLDRVGARTMPHREIARLLADRGYVANGWWCQTVTVEYERAIARRAVGQTTPGNYEIGAQRTLSLPPHQVWAFLTSPAARRLWLGATSSFYPEKGSTYQTREGTRGEIRSLAQGNICD